MSKKEVIVQETRSELFCDFCDISIPEGNFHSYAGYDFHAKCAYDMYKLLNKKEKGLDNE